MYSKPHSAIFTAAAGVLAANGASAADATQRWTGFYLGAHANAAEGVSGNDKTKNFDFDGYGAGARVGYNFGYEGFVLSAEAQASFLDYSGRSDLFFAGKNGLNSVDATVTKEFSSEGSLRARLGLPVEDGGLFDNVLFYGTGGISWIHTEATYADTESVIQTQSRTHQGIVAGGGIEAAIDDRLSILVEVTTTQYDTQNYGFRFGVDSFQDEVVTGTIGVNWNLGE